MAKQKQHESNANPALPSEQRQEVVQALREQIDSPVPYHGCRIRDLTPDTPASMWPTSLDKTEPSQRAAIFNAGNPADVTCPLGGKVTFTACHWLMYIDERMDEESGEVKALAVLVLFDCDGKTFKTFSQFAPRRLKAALELYAPDQWINGVTFVVTDRASKMPGRHYHDIRIVINPQ